MPLVDSHCHLQDEKFDVDREDVIARSLEILDWLVVIGEGMETSRQAYGLIQENVYATVGVHPYYAAQINDETLNELREMAEHPSVVAIGEIGLDYFKYNDTPKDVQESGFRKQLELACDMNLPVVIHNRESSDDLSTIIEDYSDSLPGGILHCFAGSTEFVERVLGWGFHISFAGNVTFPKAEELRIAAREVPLDRLLVETDAPYLAPQAVRGKRCEPAYTRHTAEFLAELKGVSYDELSTATARNAAQLFAIQSDLS
jgi:TatD DNase family protein